MRALTLPLVGRGDSFLYTYCRLLAVPLFGGLYRCRSTGFEHLPIDGPAIVVTNHKSNVDPVIAGMVCDRPLRYLAKRELFENGALRWLIVSLGAFPIDRGAGDREAMRTALDCLAAGDIILMFPEGSRHIDDEVHEFLPGAAMIAVRSGAPVIPLAMRGTQHILADGRPGLPALRTAMGPAVALDDLTTRSSATYRAAARRMHAAVAELYAGLR